VADDALRAVRADTQQGGAGRARAGRDGHGLVGIRHTDVAPRRCAVRDRVPLARPVTILLRNSTAVGENIGTYDRDVSPPTAATPSGARLTRGRAPRATPASAARPR